MAADRSRFTLRFDGAVADDGVMNLREFNTSLGGVDRIYRETVMALGAMATDGLQVDGHIRHQCVIINFLASDEFRQTVGPLIQSVDAIEALKSVIELCGSGADFLIKALTLGVGGPIAIEHYRKAKADRIRSQARQRLAEYRLQAVTQTSAAVQFAQALENRVSTSQLPSIDAAGLRRLTRPQVVADLLEGAGEVLLPLATGSAESLTVSGGRSPAVTITSDIVTSAIRGAKLDDITIEEIAAERMASRTAIEPRRLDALEEATITFEGAQLDGRPSGWRVRLGDKHYGAYIEDRSFLSKIAAAEEQVTPMKSYRVHYRIRVSETGRVSLRIVQVEPASQARDVL